jgi:hypothetical protein
VGTVAAWAELLADYEVLQPFPQLARDVHALTEAERAAPLLERFVDATVPTVRILGFAARGWVRGTPQDAGIQIEAHRAAPGGRLVVVDLDPGIVVGEPQAWPVQRVRAVWITDGSPDVGARRGARLRFGDLDDVTASEVLRDLEALTAS